MKYNELTKRLKEYAEWAYGNEREVPICMGSDLRDAATYISDLSAENQALRNSANRFKAECAELRDQIIDLETQHRTEMCEDGYDCVELGRARTENTKLRAELEEVTRKLIDYKSFFNVFSPRGGLRGYVQIGFDDQGIVAYASPNGDLTTGRIARCDRYGVKCSENGINGPWIALEDIEKKGIGKARWIKNNDDSLDGSYYCSHCHSVIDIATGKETPLDRGLAYCPNCGAKMDREDTSCK